MVGVNYLLIMMWAAIAFFCLNKIGFIEDVLYVFVLVLLVGVLKLFIADQLRSFLKEKRQLLIFNFLKMNLIKVGLLQRICWLLDLDKFKFNIVLNFFKQISNVICNNSYLIYSSIIYFIEFGVILNWILVKGLLDIVLINSKVKWYSVNKFLSIYMFFLIGNLKYFRFGKRNGKIGTAIRFIRIFNEIEKG